MIESLWRSRRVLWVLLALTVVAQLSVPARMILGSEKVLREGELYRFRTAPVDPYDAFRGRYVSLRFDAGTEPVALASTELGEPAPQQGETLFSDLVHDEEGFARLTHLHRRAPNDGPYLRVEVRRPLEDRIWIALPFDRYYLNEALAPRAEELYRSANRQGAQEAWATVRILDGHATLEELYVGGLPIREALRQWEAKEGE